MKKRRLQRHGNSLALVIDKAILDLYGWDALTELEMTTKEDGILLKKSIDVADLLDGLLTEGSSDATFGGDSS